MYVYMYGKVRNLLYWVVNLDGGDGGCHCGGRVTMSAWAWEEEVVVL